MRQKNQSSTYDDLYPESLDTQIKISKDTTGLTSQNVSQALMELNTKEDIDNVDYDMDIL